MCQICIDSLIHCNSLVDVLTRAMWFTVQTGCVGLLLNLLVLTVIIAYEVIPQQHSAVHIFVANLAAIDAAVSLFLILTLSSEYSPTTHVLRQSSLKDRLLCSLWYSQPVLWGLLTSSAYGIVAMALDTYLSVVYQSWYRIAFTKRKVCRLRRTVGARK